MRRDKWEMIVQEKSSQEARVGWPQDDLTLTTHLLHSCRKPALTITETVTGKYISWLISIKYTRLR